jgi:hypothetical protein
MFLDNIIRKEIMLLDNLIMRIEEEDNALAKFDNDEDNEGNEEDNVLAQFDNEEDNEEDNEDNALG